MINITDHIDFKKILTKYDHLFLDDMGLTPVLGCEIEFYSKKSKAFLQKFCDKNSVELSEEEGKKQFEIKLPPVKSPLALAKKIDYLKSEMKDFADFSPKPYKEQPASGMHIHINFLNSENQNIYKRINSKTPKLLAYSIGGLIKTMEESCIFFAPSEDSYQRFSIPSMTTPSKISWGINNRTAAIRITPMEKGPRRIECRIPSSDAEPTKVLSAIFSGIYLGITNKILPPEPIYGICSDSQYNLKDLPHSLDKAKKLALNGTLSSIFSEILASS